MTDPQAPRMDFSSSRPMRKRGVERNNHPASTRPRGFLGDNSDEDICCEIAEAAEVPPPPSITSFPTAMPPFVALGVALQRADLSRPRSRRWPIPSLRPGRNCCT